MKMEFLVENMVPKGMLSSLVGSSETGKTQLAFQLAAAIAAGSKNVLGLRLNTTHKKVVIIPTEDPIPSINRRFENLRKIYSDEINSRIRFCFDVSENPIEEVQKMLKEEPADLLVLDTFQDFFEGDINRSTDVRPFLEGYKKMAEETGCSVLFIHHVNKAAYGGIASKKSILGSQSYEAKMRSIISLDNTSKSTIKALKILKGNLVSEDAKVSSRRTLKLEENITFSLANMAVETEDHPKSLKEQAKNLIIKNNLQNLSIRDVTTILEKQYKLTLGKTTVSGILKELRELK